MEYRIVQHVFGGIRVAVAVLIVNAVITLGKKALADILCIAISIAAFLVSVFIPSVSPILIVLAATAIGLATMKKGGNAK
jgi:chromate transporter